METKKCTHCGKELSFDQFYKNNARKDGHDAKCKKCRSMLAKKIAGIPISHPDIKESLKIEDFTDESLFTEIKKRGYTGELQYSRTIII